MAKDLYKILGVSRSADDHEIKKAYRRLAQKYHPDRNKGDKQIEEKFKEINAAYQVLSDKSKRSQYDRFGESGLGGGGQGGFSGTGFDFENFGGGFADIFETFFGGGRPRTRTSAQKRGNDIEAQLRINFEDAIFGSEHKIALVKESGCKECGGKGYAKGSRMTACETCKGSGEIRSVRSTILGQIASAQICHMCYGSGHVPEKKCSICGGLGRVRGREEITIKIPAGIENRTTIRLSGRGDAGMQGGENGDLYLHVTVEPSKKWQRRGYDILGEEKIDLLQGVLGDQIKIETVHGQVSLKIPAGTQSGQVFRVRNYGVPKPQSNDRGDYYVTVSLEIPKKVSRKERELYQQLAELKGLNLESGKAGFWG